MKIWEIVKFSKDSALSTANDFKFLVLLKKLLVQMRSLEYIRISRWQPSQWDNIQRTSHSLTLTMWLIHAHLQNLSLNRMFTVLVSL